MHFCACIFIFAYHGRSRGENLLASVDVLNVCMQNSRGVPYEYRSTVIQSVDLHALVKIPYMHLSKAKGT